MKAEIIFAWYDFWIGLFWDRKKHWLYIFPIPMVGIVLKFANTIDFVKLFKNSRLFKQR